MPRPIMLLDHTTLQHAWPDANAAEFLITMREDIGPMLPNWPRDLQTDFSEAIARWRDHNETRRVVALTSACAPDPGSPGKFTATVVLHHVALHAPAAETNGEGHAEQA